MVYGMYASPPLAMDFLLGLLRDENEYGDDDGDDDTMIMSMMTIS